MTTTTKEKLKDIGAEMRRHAEDAQQRYDEGLARYADGTLRCVLSHAEWAPLAAAAGLDRVTTHTVGTFETQTLMDAWDGTSDARARIEDAERTIERAVVALEAEHGPMVMRADYCAPARVKSICASGRDHALIAGRAAREEAPLRTCMRIAEHAGEWPRRTIAVHARPYTAPRIADGYPVELRVWVCDSHVRAVANYYPQRALDPTHEVHEAITKAIVGAYHLGAACAPFDLIPMHPEAGQGVSFTADFLMREDGSCAWLECGPYTFPGWGAHPCAIDDLNVLNPNAPTHRVHLALGAIDSYRPGTNTQ